MYSRVDVPKFQTGLKDAVNVVLRAQGGAASRSGTLLSGGYDNAKRDGDDVVAYPWLIPFEFSTDDSYQLEFADQVMRVIKNGEYVLTGAARTINELRPVDPGTLRFPSPGDAADFPAGKLFYVSDPNGTSKLHTAVLKSTAVASADVTFEIISGETIDGNNAGWGAFGPGATAQPVFELETPYAIEDLPTLYPAQDVDTLILAHDSYETQVLQRGDADDVWTIEELDFTPTVSPPDNPVGDAVNAGASSSLQYTYVVAARNFIGGGSYQEQFITDEVTVSADFTKNGTAVNVSWPLLPSSVTSVTTVDRYTVYRKLGAGDFRLLSDVSDARTAYTDDGSVTPDPTDTIDPATTAAGTRDNFRVAADVRAPDSTLFPEQYVVTAVVGGEESLRSSIVTLENDLSIADHVNRISWDEVENAEFYNIYKNFNGIYGFIGVTTALSFDDDNITPDTADNPPTARDPFDGEDRQPRVATFVENRLTLAGPAADPQVVEMSTSINPFNFNRSITPGASDAVTFRMRAQKLNRIEHVVPLEVPVILTAGAEWVMLTQDDAPIQPANFALRPRSYRGSTSVRPVVIGETLIHVARDGNSLREFSLRESRDFPSADLTVLARHLFRGKTVTSMDYAQAPDGVLWVTFADGTLLSMTYLEEHEVWGWTRHQLGGADTKVKQVSVVREGAFDTPYFVVERTIRGVPQVTVERLDTRSFADVTEAHFVDAGLIFTGSGFTEMRGLLHLSGEDVAVLADGAVEEGLSVDQFGAVTLQQGADRVSVGLGYDAYLVTLPIDFGDSIQNTGSAVGDFRAPSEVALQVVDTRGLSVGREGGWLNEYKQFTGVEPIPTVTGTIVVTIEGDWERDSSIEVRQTYPLPMEVTSAVPEWSLGG